MNICNLFILKSFSGRCYTFERICCFVCLAYVYHVRKYMKGDILRAIYSLLYKMHIFGE